MPFVVFLLDSLLVLAPAARTKPATVFMFLGRFQSVSRAPGWGSCHDYCHAGLILVSVGAPWRTSTVLIANSDELRNDADSYSCSRMPFDFRRKCACCEPCSPRGILLGRDTQCEERHSVALFRGFRLRFTRTGGRAESFRRRLVIIVDRTFLPQRVWCVVGNGQKCEEDPRNFSTGWKRRPL